MLSSNIVVSFLELIYLVRFGSSTAVVSMKMIDEKTPTYLFTVLVLICGQLLCICHIVSQSAPYLHFHNTWNSSVCISRRV